MYITRKKWYHNNTLLCGQCLVQVFSSVQFSHSVVSDSLQSHESQHARPPCPSPAPGVYSNSCPSSRWCHPAISSSVVAFSSCPQSLPASGSFPMSQLFAWGGPKYWSVSFSISPSSEHPGLISFSSGVQYAQLHKCFKNVSVCPQYLGGRSFGLTSSPIICQLCSFGEVP